MGEESEEREREGRKEGGKERREREREGREGRKRGERGKEVEVGESELRKKGDFISCSVYVAGSP